jgi:stage IV sporulation protein FB
MKRGYLVLPLGNLSLRVHLLLPVAVAALAFFWPRYLVPYLALLATVALHETGHVAASFAVGGRRAVLLLLPYFAFARVEELRDRRQAFVALAGPAMNLLAAGGLALAGAVVEFALIEARLPDFLLTVNLVMGAGNLVPLPPMDGGRILLALLARAAEEPGDS